ncbi:MAG: helix-hairpin-helix domain-containing protein [Smithella sp.]
MKPETITVKIEKIQYSKPDTKWRILKTDAGKATGVISFDVKDGDMVQLTGEWKISNFDGANEFVFKLALMAVPEDSHALLHYAVEITKGLGGTAEARIWGKYGEEWPKSDLSEIPKITDSARMNWITTIERLKSQKEQTQAISFLMGKGCTLNMSTVAWNRWGVKTVSTVQGNCYELTELPYYGFVMVDEKIRPQFGIQDADPRRMEAAIIYVMQQLTESAGSLVEVETLRAELMKIFPFDVPESAFYALETKKKIKILSQSVIALQQHWENDIIIWKELCA